MIKVKFTWICDICGKTESEWHYTETYTDVSAHVLEQWVDDLPVPLEYRDYPTDDICDACPDCKINPDWEKYKARAKLRDV